MLTSERKREEMLKFFLLPQGEAAFPIALIPCPIDFGVQIY